MDVAVFVDSIIEVQDQIDATSCNEDTQQSFCADFKTQSDTAEKHSAVWTSSATSTLLKLYELKLDILETPKRKKRIWLAISESLKEHQIDVSPDQVRWKINALTKKYKRCLDTGANEKFKYFKEMDQVYSKFNIDSNYGYTISEILDSKSHNHRTTPNKNGLARSESKAIIELRKMRLANRLEADRSQTKIHIEKQWLDYLNRQEQMKMQRDEIIDMHLEIKEQELELKKKELELKSLELENMHLKEQELNEFILAEREKCELLKQLFR